MLSRAFRIANIGGVEVRLDPSLALLALLLSWLLWTRFSAAHGPTVGLTMAILGTGLFFLSILAHELGHALEARHRKIKVEAITLLLFGGVTEMRSESRTPRDEFVIAAIGPYLSLVCAGLFHIIGAAANQWLPVAVARPVAELTMLLAYLNLLIAVFNLVPGAPLDGGRVLRAALWWLWGDRRRAVRGAARSGQVFGLLVMALGVWEFAAGLEVAALGGLWWLLIGAFLFNAARNELRQADAQAVLRVNTAADVLGGLPYRLPADTAAATLRLPHPGPDHVLVVTPGTDEVIGWVPASELLGEPVGARTLGDLALPVAVLPATTLHAPLVEVVHGFVNGAHQLRVEDGGRVVAVLTERRVAETLRQLDRTQRTGGGSGRRGGHQHVH